MIALRPTIALVVALAVAGPGRAAADDRDRPPTSHLLWAGAAMALPTYVVGVVAHEGGHALAARLVGADVVELDLLPGVRDGHFYFGYVRTTGLRTRADRTWFLLAPKLIDLAMLGGYAGLTLTGHTPDRPYGQLALAVLATGFWVDFSKDIPAWWGHSDVVKLYDLHGARTEWRRLPWRLVHAGLSAAAGFAIVRGYRDLFARPVAGSDVALILPLGQGRF